MVYMKRTVRRENQNFMLNSNRENLNTVNNQQKKRVGFLIINI